jgi:hypothetical protein
MFSRHGVDHQREPQERAEDRDEHSGRLQRALAWLQQNAARFS